MTPRRALGRSARMIARLLAGVGLVAVFVIAAIFGLLLHADLPAGRRLAAALLTNVLSRTFYGDFYVGEIEHIGPYSVVAKDIRVEDEQGRAVVQADRLAARLNIPLLAQEALLGGKTLDLVINHVRLERAEVDVVPHPKTGVPTIAQVFLPIEDPKDPAEPPSEPGRQLRLWMPTIELGRVHGNIEIADGPKFEATLTGAHGSVYVSPDGVAIDVERYGMQVRGLEALDRFSSVGTGEFHFRGPDRLWSVFDGFFDQVQLEARFSLQGDRLKLLAELPRVRPEDARQLLPEWPLQRAVAAHLSAEGRLPELDVAGKVRIRGAGGAPDATLDAQGTLDLSDLAVSAELTGKRVDARAFSPDAPATQLDFESAVSLWNKEGQLVVDVNATTQPLELQGEHLPAVDLSATYNEAGIAGTATLHEPGVPAKVDFSVHPDGRVDATLRTRKFHLGASPRLRELTAARGQVEARVDAQIDDGQLSAKLQADVQDFTLGELELRQGRLEGRVTGPLQTPEALSIDASLRGRGGRAERFEFERVDATAKGPLRRPKVTAALEDDVGPSVRAQAEVDLRQGAPKLQGLDLEIRRGDTGIQGTVGRVAVGPAGVEISGIDLKGAAGTLRGEVSISDKAIRIDIEGEDVDLERAAQALGLPRGYAAGRLRIDADITADEDDQRGSLSLALADGTIRSVGGVSLRLDSRLEGEHLEGELSAEVLDLGGLTASWDTRVGGPITRTESWEDVVGTLQLQVTNVDLSTLGLFLPPELGIEELAGTAYGQARIERAAPETLPSVLLVAATQDLQVVRAATEPEGTPLRIQGLDLQAGGALNGETGESSGTTRIVDETGPLASASGSIELDLARMLENPSGIGEQLMATPLEAVVVVSDRNLATWPAFIQLPGVQGVVGGRVAVSGSLNEPSFAAAVSGRNLMTEGSRFARPLDLQANAQYQKKTGAFGGSVQLFQRGRRVASLVASGKADWNKLAERARIDEPDWTGGAQLALDGLPLDTFAPLADAHIGGRLYGAISMQRVRARPMVTANVEVREMTVDTLAVGGGRLTLRSDGELVKGALSLQQQRGHLDGQLLAGLSWDGAAPSIDASRPVHASLDARGYNAAILRPVLGDLFTEFGGQLDASLQARLQARPKAGDAEAREWHGTLEGDVSLQKGEVQLTALGLRLQDVTLRANARGKDSQTRIAVTELTARARADSRNLSARAEIVLEGLELDAASASANLRAVPILVEGVSQAQATGQLTAVLERREDHMRVEVNVPELTARLPIASARNLIALDDNPSIEVLQPLGKPEDAGPGTPGLPWVVLIDLGRNVKVVRTDLNVPLTGRPELRIGEEVELAGTIELEPGGRVQLMGKAFVIEGGTIRFVNEAEPGNPELAITASWRGPEHMVFIEIRGNVQDPDISFRSEPALPEPEVIALLLGGTGEGASALATGGGVGASLFNQLFADTPLGRLELRTGATEEGQARFIAAVQISDRVWFEATYQQPGNQSVNNPSDVPGVSGTVDWRFHRNWSLRTELGSLGAAADLLWQYRY